MRGIAASGCHTSCVAALRLNRMDPVAGIASLKHEFELPAPARPGDRLNVTMTCAEKRIFETKPDRGLVTFKSVLTNEAGTVVLKLRAPMMIKMREEASKGLPA
jgi:acyl dehydratase